MNYIGDWGRQFGLLAAGFKRFGCEESLQQDPIQHLFEVYVATNAAAEEDTGLSTEARRVVELLEARDPDTLAVWEKFRVLSIEAYNTMYARLHIKFDQINSESEYAPEARVQASKLKDMGVLLEEANGAWVVDLTDRNLAHAVIIKEDGATVYLTRDIAAAIGRKAITEFDELIYVAGATQDTHFQQLFHLLQTLGHDWASACQHVNFGQVQGMSTRRGEVVFLKDILDEAKAQMLGILKRDPAKHDRLSDPDGTAEALGLSAVVVQDLKSRRVKGYKFEWDRILKVEGDTGPFLQYTHARLRSIHVVSGIPIDHTCDLSSLTEPVAHQLVGWISQYDETLERSLEQLEPAVLVQYLFKLARTASKAQAALRVKGAPHDVALARMLLFHQTRTVLGSGLAMLGLTPLKSV